jgi:hypothetical protein
MRVSGQRHAPAVLYPRGKNPRYPLYRRLGGPQSRSGHRDYRKNLLPLPDIEHWSPGRSVCSQDTKLTELPPAAGLYFDYTSDAPRFNLVKVTSHMQLAFTGIPCFSVTILRTMTTYFLSNRHSLSPTLFREYVQQCLFLNQARDLFPHGTR